MTSTATLIAALATGMVIGSEPLPGARTLPTREIGLREDEVAAIRRGEAITRVLPSKTPAEIVLLGAVYVTAAPEAYVGLAFDMDRLRRLPGYKAVAQLSEPPSLADFEGFTLEPADIRSLRQCRAGRCAVQLPVDAMEAIQRGVDWTASDAGARVNGEAQAMALRLVQRYRETGNDALGTYHDKARPVDVAAVVGSLMRRSEALPVSVPELNRYLRDYPRDRLQAVGSQFYWEKVDFGLKPTLRVNHAVAYRSLDPDRAAWVVAVKQLYASHYFRAALDLTACVPDPGGSGFFLISLKSSSQDGLTGLKGSLVRRAVVGRTRSAQAKALLAIRHALERRQSAPPRH